MPLNLRKNYHLVLDVLRAFFAVAFTVRFSLAMSLFASLALFIPQQALEALRVLAAPDEPAVRSQRILFVVSALTLSLISWYCARVILYLIDPLPNPKPGGQAGAKEVIIKYLPRVVGALPLVFIGFALLRADDNLSVELKGHRMVIKVLAGLSFFFAAFFYVLIHYRRALTERLTGKAMGSAKQQAGVLHPKRLARVGKVVFFVTLAVLVALMILFSSQSGRVTAVSAAGWFGVGALVLLFAAVWIPLGTALVYLGHRTRLPLFILLLCWAVFWSMLDLNDNHRIRYASVTRNEEQGFKPADEGTLKAKPLKVGEGFRAWLDSRCDKDDYKDKGYPVFIVSAEGGGIRAAYFAAVVLSALQDQDPKFAHHVFAVSGVSGGSLGGAVFAGLTHKYTKTRAAGGPCYETAPPPGGATMVAMTDQVLGRDLLSPILSSALFPDFVQRLLPFAVDKFDRARALEDALGKSWQDATRDGDKLFFPDSPVRFHDLWKPDQSVPALFLNTTQVETGERMVVSSLDPSGAEGDRRFNDLISITRVDPTLNIPLGTAACLSARFPVITPAGYLTVKRRVKDKEGREDEKILKYRYVDGGYFENSGTATVMDIITGGRLHEVSRASGMKVNLIVIRIGTDPEGFQYTRQGLGEITSPIFTLLNTRNARGTLATKHLDTRLDEFNDALALAASSQPAAVAPGPGSFSAVVPAVHFQVNEGGKVKLPLGWLLSQEAREEMKCQIGEPRQDGRPSDRPCGFPENGANLRAFKQVTDALGVKAPAPAQASARAR
jgi:predicted acylesterase/phospholipase RssA